MIEKIKEIHKQMIKANEKIVEIIKNSNISQEKKDELIAECEQLNSTMLSTQRQDLSNPYRNIPHEELLKKIGAVDLKDNYKIEHLDNGNIVVSPIDKTKKFK